MRRLATVSSSSSLAPGQLALTERLPSCNHCVRRGLGDACEFPADAQPPLASASTPPGNRTTGGLAASAREQPLVWKSASQLDRFNESADGASSSKGKERAEVGNPVAPQLSVEDGDQPACAFSFSALW